MFEKVCLAVNSGKHSTFEWIFVARLLQFCVFVPHFVARTDDTDIIWVH